METERMLGWLQKERDWTEESLGVPQSPSLVQQPDTRLGKTENCKAIYDLPVSNLIMIYNRLYWYKQNNYLHTMCKTTYNGQVPIQLEQNTKPKLKNTL